MDRFSPSPPTSWNDSAANALLMFLPGGHGQYVCEPFPLSHYFPMLRHDSDLVGRLGRLRASVDRLIEVQFGDDGNTRASGVSSDEIVQCWRQIGFYGREFGVMACPGSPLDFGSVAEEVHRTLVRKQTDYGHENIRRFGRIGLIVRIQDKVARLENLVAKGATDGPRNESIFDNVVDVMGYSAIGLMWEANTFLLPLKGDAQLEVLPL